MLTWEANMFPEEIKNGKLFEDLGLRFSFMKRTSGGGTHFAFDLD